MAATLRAQDASDFSMILLRLALDLRPGFHRRAACCSPISWRRAQHPEDALHDAGGGAGERPAGRGGPAAPRRLTDRLGQTDEATSELRAARPRLSGQPDAAGAGGRHAARARSASPTRSRPMTAAIARLGSAEPGDWLLFYDRGIALRAVAPVAEGGGRLQARAAARAGPAVRAELSRLFLGRQGENLRRGAADDRAGALQRGRTTGRSSIAWAG